MSGRDESPRPIQKKYICQHCNLTLDGFQDLENHLLQKHQPNRIRDISCECGASFVNRKGLMSHMLQKHTEKTLKCDKCDFSTARKNQLVEHKHIHNTDKPFPCSLCSTWYRTKRNLANHKRNVHNNRTYGCIWPNCNRHFSRKSRLDEHIRTCHDATHRLATISYKPIGLIPIPPKPEPKPEPKKITYPCNWAGCEKVFPSSIAYKKHHDWHTKPFACTWVDCCKTFGSSILLQGHLNDHKGNRPYCCGNDDCSKSFATKDGLRQHMKLSHIGVKSEKCDWPNCEKTFVHLSRLLVHRRTHTQEKPYPCDRVSCGQAFSTSGSLRIHQQRYHLGRCEACLSAGQSETTAAFIHIRFAAEKLCIVCAQFKYSPEVVFRTEYHLATYIRNRFADHPNVRAIIWNSSDPDDKERCTRFRPDLRILTHTVGDGIIECDENGHKPYQCSIKEIQEAWSELQLTKQSHFERQKIKEDSRLSQLVTSGTIDRTVAWRLNPDRSIDENGDVFAENQAIDSNGNRVVMNLVAARERRFEMLGDEVQAWLDGKWDMSKLPFIYVVYMFYDGPWRQESLVPIDGDEYKIWLKELETKTRTIGEHIE